MSRYIDASYYEDCRIVLNSEDKGVNVKDIPTADVVEVLRCKDCKHFRVWETGSPTCEHWTYVDDVSTDPDAFCSYGERR